MNAGPSDKRLVLFIAEYSYLLSHRLSLAQAAVAAGYEVYAITGIPQPGSIVELPHIHVSHLALQRSIRNPFKDLIAVWKLTGKLREIGPSILHNVSIKLVVIGSLAAFMARVPVIINAYTGLGYVFRTRNIKTTMIRLLLQPVLRWIARDRRCWSIFQNEDDAQRLTEFCSLDEQRTALIRGSGVDINQYKPAAGPQGDPVVLFAGRLLRDKGIEEFVQAAQILQQRNVKAKFLVAGDIDPENPHSIDKQTLTRWRSETDIEWLGTQADMPGLYRRSHIFCLPTYHEGLPKVLLEAAACGKAIVTTDIPGCRELIEDGVSGYLVAPGDAEALAGRIEKLLKNNNLRDEFGDRARTTVTDYFAGEIINRQILELYQRATNR